MFLFLAKFAPNTSFSPISGTIYGGCEPVYSQEQGTYGCVPGSAE